MKEGLLLGTPQTRLEQRGSLCDEGEVCLEHSSPVELICLSCWGRLLCAACLQAHGPGHEVRSIDRARQHIYTQYQEWMIRLSSKSEILDIIHVQFENTKANINLISKKYKEKLASELAEIVAVAERKLQELSTNIDGFIREYIFEMSAHMEQIRSQRKEIEKLIARYDKDRMELVSLPELAAYSYEIRNKVALLLGEQDIAALKQKLREPEWKLSNDLFQTIKNTIAAVTISFNDAPPKPHPEPERPNKKSKKDLRIFDPNERDRSENKLKLPANPFAQTTLTPSNKSREKKVKQKRSPEPELLKKRKKSAKMISMPASPAKEVESTYLITPELSRKKLFKKK